VAQRRAVLLARFESWLWCTHGTTVEATRSDPPALDAALAEYGQVLWNGGEPQSGFPELLNCIAKRWSALKGHLRSAWDVRTAWQHLEPGQNKAPVPPQLVRAIVSVAALWGWLEVAAIVALAFEGSLRPGDVLGLCRHDVRFVEEHGGLRPDVFVVLRTAKTAFTHGARWQHVRICCPTVIALLRHAVANRPGNAHVFTCAGSLPQRARALAARFQALVEFLGCPYGQQRGFVFSGLRAGGTTALFECTGDLALTRWRGRWDAWRSMEHYIQELAAATAFSSMSPSVRARVARLSALLPQVLEQALRS